MKKAIVLLLALMLVGSAFAEGAAYSLSGYGEVKWGYNLDTGRHGFAWNSDLTFDLELGGNASKTGKEGETVYGKVTLADFSVNISADDEDQTPAFDAPDATITADIIMGDLDIGLNSMTSLSFNNAAMFSPWKDDDADWSDANYVRARTATAAGLSFTYKLGDLGSVYAKLASLGTWKTDTVKDDQYAVAGGFTLKPVGALLTITGGGVYDLYTKFAGASGKVAVAAGDLAANAAVDVALPDGADMLMDISGMVEYKLMEGKDKVGAYVYMLPQDTTTALVHAVTATKQTNVKVMISDAGGFVEGLALDLAVFAMDLTGTAKIAVADSLSYTVKLDNGTVKPYQKLIFDVDGSTESMYLVVGVEAKIITNTTITLDYTDNTYTNKAYPVSMVAADATTPALTLKARVSF
ncbi:MAG: hypothetical protein Q8M76_16720 [Spirochaetaceae bacterium]|nr:hypothetical protein [Spirochaetaceae bacterium]